MSTQNKSITDVFQDEIHQECEDCKSIFSPAAYLVKLLDNIDKYITPEGVLRKRRPDLYSLKLNCDNTLKEKLYLEVVNEIMQNRIDDGKEDFEKLGEWLKVFATDYWTSGLPFFLRQNFPLLSIRTYLKENSSSLKQIYPLFQAGTDLTAETLGFSPESYELLITLNNTESDIKSIYGYLQTVSLPELLEDLKRREHFIKRSGIQEDTLSELLEVCNKIMNLSGDAQLSLESQSESVNKVNTTYYIIKNLNADTLYVLHRIVALSHHMGCSFSAMSYLIMALSIDLKIIDQEKIREHLVKMASIKELGEQFDQDLTLGYKEYILEDALHPSTSLLYLSEGLFKEKVKKLLGEENYDKLSQVDIHDIKSSDQMGVLQGILALSAEGLSALINYHVGISSENVPVESILPDLYAESTLAQFMGISIEELLYLMKLLSGQRALSLSLAEDVAQVMTLYKELQTYSMSSEDLIKLLGSNDEIKARYADQIKALLETLGGINPWDESEFSHALGGYFTLNQDTLSAVTAFSQVRTGKSFENPQERSDLLVELIKDIELFGALQLAGEDVNHMSKHYEKVYQLEQGNWNLAAIEKLLYYRELKGLFGNNTLGLIPYIDWLYGEEYTQEGVTQKISELSRWDKEILELLKGDDDFKECFTQEKNPIEALKKINTLMDVLFSSGLNAKILLELKGLRALKADTNWEKYVDAATHLKLLGEHSDKREESQKTLQEQKRDLLSGYMLWGSDVLDNLRDLYAELLIDVEMSGCSKISPLKAALNSTQLYLHRCSMRLEEGTSIDPELSKQTLDLLGNYRKWEAAQKIQTHPENYLDPTLRKIASPQFGALQNTLMQGNITQEAVSDAYLGYFEDFDQLASLEVIDSYFDAVEDPISGGEKNTMFLLGRSIAQPYAYYYCTAIFASEDPGECQDKIISYWTPWQKIEASIPVDTVTSIYAFGRFFLFWVERVEKKDAKVNTSEGSFTLSGSLNVEYTDSVSFSIRYVFQRISGKWSEVQTLADDVAIPDQASGELYWKKVAAMQFKDKKQEGTKYMIVSIGDIKKDNAPWYLMDEDLIAKEQTGKLSLDDFSQEEYKLSNYLLDKTYTSGKDVITIGDEVIFYQDIGQGVVLDIYDNKTGKWSSSEENKTGSELRYDPAVAVIGNKKVVFFSGRKSGSSLLSGSIDVYNCETKKWEKPQIPQGYAIEGRLNTSIGVAVVGEKAIFFGGRYGGNYSSSIDIYDAQRNELKKSQYVIDARENVRAAVIDQKAFFFGGVQVINNQEHVFSNVEIYDNATDKWSTSNYEDLKEHWNFTLALIGKKVIIFSGFKKETSSSIHIYDTQTGLWKKESYQTPEARWDVSVALIGKKVIFFGGIKDPGAEKPSSAIDIYDDETGEWKSYHSSEARAYASVAVLCKKVIFFGGRDGDQNSLVYSSAVDIYDDETGGWTGFKVENTLKDPTVVMKGSKGTFVGVDKEDKARKYIIEAYYYRDICYLKDGKKLLINALQDSLFYANFFPSATANPSKKGCPATLLENYTESLSSVYPVRNLLGGYMVRNGLEVFLSLPKEYTQYPIISNYSSYDSDTKKLDYSPPDEDKPDLTELTFAFLRLNMSKGVSLLRQRAYAGGVKRLLSLDSQKFEIPDFSILKPTPQVIPPSDLSLFEGPYGLYLWEVFFHIPTLVWWHLNSDQAFSDAKTWQEYIINPDNENEEIWQFLPFRELKDHEKLLSFLENCQSDRDMEIDPFDAYSIAAQDITSFEKYVVISYIDNLLTWADMLFEEGSWESLNEATMIYVRAWDLLGIKPVLKGKTQGEDKSYDELQGSYEKNMKLLDLERLLKSDHARGVPQRILAVTEAISMADYEDYFCTPENEGLVSLWDKLQDRLYKIRHCLDITGQPHMPALFEPPLDPKALMQASAAGGSGISVPEISKIPFYRFDYMIGYAKSIVDMVIGLGSELLSVMEKKDAESLSALYNKQESILATLITPIKEKAIEALGQENKSLNESLNNANYRKKYYADLILNGLSAKENTADNLVSEAIDLRMTSKGIKGAAVAAHFVPTVFGFSCGAFQPGASVDAAAGIMDFLADYNSEKSQMASTSASYERRAEEWSLQRDLADFDIKQIQAQIEANRVQQESAQKDLQSHQKSIEQMKEKKDFFDQKFTREELYSWMKGQIAAVYFQAYKLALKIAKQAEKTYQYELNTEDIFVTSNGWNSLKEGLLAGHQLKFALEQMHATYHDQDQRDLEISRSISLKEIDPYALYQLKTEGACQFSFTEKLFDLDFPGHYNRKIKALRMTLPALVGPYESLHASLQQTSNKTVLKAEGNAIEAVKFLLGEKGASDPNDPNVLRSNVNMNQLIALSRGDKDSGMFELNFNDTRYLPFEGTGAISDWRLKLPKKNNRFDIESISDVIIHLDYTASDGGEMFAEQVEKLETLKTYQGLCAVNLIAAFREEWEQFKEEKEAFVFQPSIGLFPSYLSEIKADASQKLYAIPATSEEEAGVKIDQLNNTPFQSDHSLTIASAADFALGKDWSMKISGDLNQIQEILLLFPFIAQRL